MATPVESVKACDDIEQPSLRLEEEQDADIPGQCVVCHIGWRNLVNLGAYLVNTFVTYTSLTGVFGATNSELSKKYQTLVTPSGWAFSIWGPIFIWEGIFVVAQLFPRFRNAKVISLMSPWWWSVCFCQVAWTIAFAQDSVVLALAFMLGILMSLLGISWVTDGLQLTPGEYFLLRAPMSLQLGWIIVASAVNVNVQADAAQSSQETLLALAVTSNAALLVAASIFTFAVRSPDAFIGMVAAWAFAGISSGLGNPSDLNDPTRFNASVWGTVILGGLQNAAVINSLLAVLLAVIAAVSRLSWGSRPCHA